jgi:hypothetical protein
LSSEKLSDSAKGIFASGVLTNKQMKELPFLALCVIVFHSWNRYLKRTFYRTNVLLPNTMEKEIKISDFMDIPL